MADDEVRITDKLCKLTSMVYCIIRRDIVRLTQYSRKKEAMSKIPMARIILNVRISNYGYRGEVWRPQGKGQICSRHSRKQLWLLECSPNYT